MSEPRTNELTYRPSHIEGIDGFSSVRVTPEFVEFRGQEKTLRYDFRDICRPKRRPLADRVRRLFRRRPAFYAVADRDWFRMPSRMYFRWYTTPSITTYMPDDESKEKYTESYFFQIQQVLRAGGYESCDLG